MTATLSDHHTAWHRTFGRYTTCDLDCGAGEIVGEFFEADAEALAETGERGVRCGSCKQNHTSVAAVRFCYEVKYDAQTFERNDAAMVAEMVAQGECVHGMSQALCSGPNHW